MSKKFKIEDHIRNHTSLWEFPISDSYGENLVVKNEMGEDLYTYVHRNKEGYRDVELYISSFGGSFGAVHFYGKIKSHSISFCRTPEEIGINSVGGYPLKGISAEYNDFLQLELVRPVDEKDLEHDEDYGRDRWLRCKIGEKTNGFWTEEEIVKLGTKMFKKMFVGKWRLYINSYSGKFDKYVKL